MPIDNETREPTGFRIYEDRAVVMPGVKPDQSDRRTVIVRDHAVLDRLPSDGTRYDGNGTPVGIDHTSHGRVEYLGMAAVPVTSPGGAVIGQEVVHFAIPAASLYLAFQFMADDAKVGALAQAAAQAHLRTKQQAQVAGAVRGGLILPGGRQ